MNRETIGAVLLALLLLALGAAVAIVSTVGARGPVWFQPTYPDVTTPTTTTPVIFQP